MTFHSHCGYKHSQLVTVDTGCTDTLGFLAMNWSVKHKIFAKRKNDGIPQDVFDELNSKKINYTKIKIEGLNEYNSFNLITLDPPIMIGIENLNPVEISQLLVPRKTDQYDTEGLLGMDIISKFTFIFSTFNGSYGVKVMDLNEEI